MKTTTSIKITTVKRILLTVLLFCHVVMFSQQKKNKNLVPNPSFEEHKSQSSSISAATPWKGIGTVDYYTKVAKRDTSIYKGARTGKCYGGLRFQPDYKEYMYVKLLEPLKKNKTYSFKMYARLNGSSTVTIKQLGVYFSEEEFKVGMIFKEEGLIDSIHKKGLSNVAWIPIEGNYKAQGKEKYIIIGNFRTKMKDDMVKKNKWDLFEDLEAYYFIDDISVTEHTGISDSSSEEETPTRPDWIPQSSRMGSPFEIKNLAFENKTATLTESSYKILDELVDFLNDPSFIEIQINGHVNNLEDQIAEHQLSKERARVVYDYLKKRGIKSNLTYKGLGNTQPIAPNGSTEYKEQNQRIEVMIVVNQNQE